LSVHFRFLIAYDGSEFVGWQIQLGQRSVQGELTRTLQRLTGETVKVIGSGRTDSGVHALGQVAAVRLTTWKAGPRALRRALNGSLPCDISILDCRIVPDRFHPIHDCIGKRYEYRLRVGGTLDPFLRHREWFVPTSLNFEEMRTGAQLLRGLHDFSSFQTKGSARLTTTRHVRLVELEQRPTNYDSLSMQFAIEADGFLYNMVRNIVGSLVHIGRGNRPASWLGEVLEARDRLAAGPTAPPQGLYLARVDYLDSPGT
jgi:tRNA pseudouridine38-40 synthase